MKKTAIVASGLVAATTLTGPASADKLGDIILSGTLRCAAVLDFPPMDARGESNNPVGFDIDYVALVTSREEYGLVNDPNLFINRQVRTGRYTELCEKWGGGEVPDITVGGVYR